MLEGFAGASEYASHGQRVVAGQRLMQAASDIFLGWHSGQPGTAALPYDFYIRQLRDWKASADIATMTPAAMRAYGQLCGWTLAQAHARTGDRIAIAALLGRSAAFDQAIGEFAAAYADQNEHEYSPWPLLAEQGACSPSQACEARTRSLPGTAARRSRPLGRRSHHDVLTGAGIDVPAEIPQRPAPVAGLVTGRPAEPELAPSEGHGRPCQAACR
jgi:hypothetical protein